VAPSWVSGGSATDEHIDSVTIAVALGSNLGDRHAHLSFAIERLDHILKSLRVSSFHPTEPEGVGQQPEFLNAAALGQSSDGPRAVLDQLLAIERARGRERPYWGAARTLDLDLVLYGELIISEPGLRVPHPRFRERTFVLRPLAEIAPDLRDPVSGLTIRELLARLDSPT
jgi:2-amino-4-hydroxy-6-hydroxymethyldihydropteridine diphosphokinase